MSAPEKTNAAAAPSGPRLRCYALHEHAPKLAPARSHRQWMDDFTDRHAYRCLPLSIANAFGWDVLCPVPIEISWNGGPAISDLVVRGKKPLPGGRPLEHFCRSNFSRGIVTMHVDYIFRTDLGWDLLATGPFNSAKDNAAPLTGVIETDWLPYPFTMNWQILRPGRVTFDEDEPFCTVLPVQKRALLDTAPEIFRLADDPELVSQHEAFRRERDDFMRRYRAGDESAFKQAWQKHYFFGRHPDGTKVDDHLNKLRLREPVDRRAPPPTEATPPATDNARAARTDPRWADDSPLNRFADAQEQANEAGRRRIDGEGRLRDRQTTRFVRSQGDARGLDFLVVEDVLSIAECAAICRAADELNDRVFASDKIDPYWNNRILWFADVLAARPEAGRLMAEGQRRGIRRARKFFRLTRPIYPDLLQIVLWKAGMAMPPHADNANPDGSDHKMAYRDLASILYLNDDYEGGELYFTALDVAVKPKRGMFVAMSAGFHHEHAVLRVEAGLRLTMPSFLTFDATKADQTLLDMKG
jgi:hypothetical protein